MGRKKSAKLQRCYVKKILKKCNNFALETVLMVSARMKIRKTPSRRSRQAGFAVAEILGLALIFWVFFLDKPAEKKEEAKAK